MCDDLHVTRSVTCNIRLQDCNKNRLTPLARLSHSHALRSPPPATNLTRLPRLSTINEAPIERRSNRCHDAANV